MLILRLFDIYVIDASAILIEFETDERKTIIKTFITILLDMMLVIFSFRHTDSYAGCRRHEFQVPGYRLKTYILSACLPHAPCR